MASIEQNVCKPHAVYVFIFKPIVKMKSPFLKNEKSIFEK